MKILVTITTGFTLVGGLASVMMNYYRVLTKTNLNIGYMLSGKHVYNPKAVVSVMMRGSFQRTTTSTS